MSKNKGTYKNGNVMQTTGPTSPKYSNTSTSEGLATCQPRKKKPGFGEKGRGKINSTSNTKSTYKIKH